MKKYPKYKNSRIQWLGSVPEKWEVCKVKHRYSYVTGFTPDTKNLDYYDEEEGVNWVCIGDLKEKNVSYTAKKISKKYIDAFSPIKVKKGSLLYSFKLSIGNVAFAGEDLYTNEAIAAFVETEKVCLPYLYYSAPVFIKHNAAINIYGAPILNQERILDADILFPSLYEQQKIAAFLDYKTGKIDNLISLLSDRIEDIKKYRQAVISETVTHGLGKSAKMKDSGVEWIGLIPNDWKISKLKYLCEINGRIGFRGYTTSDLVASGEGAITLSPSNLKDFGMDYSKLTYLSWDKYNESPEIQIHKGDILFTKTGSSYGKCAFVDDLPMEATINPQLVMFRSFNGDARYITYCLKSPFVKKQTEDVVIGGAIPTISQEKIGNFVLPYPSLPEQQAIADYLDRKTKQIDDCIAATEQRIEDLQKYRTSLIYEAVTGQIDVRDWAPNKEKNSI